LESTPPALGDGGTIVDQALRQLERAGAFSLDETLKAWERGYIEAALRLTRGNVSQAAKLLGINRTTLYSRMNTTEEK
jgi:DNA-binding NtrC family response regulator